MSGTTSFPKGKQHYIVYNPSEYRLPDFSRDFLDFDYFWVVATQPAKSLKGNTGGGSFCWIGIQYAMPYSQKYTHPHCFFCNIAGWKDFIDCLWICKWIHLLAGEETVPKISLNITIEEVREACTSWNYTECFEGESENTCEICLDTDSSDRGGVYYLVKWKPSDNTTPASDYNYVVRWGPALFWIKDESLLIPNGSSSSKYLDDIKTVCVLWWL